jgi:peroxiredoxin Q/BCP
MQSLRDAANELAKLNAVILGISVDTAQTQKEFCAEQKLPFPLLADPEGKIAKLFGVFNEERKLSRRVTFLIDPKGIVRAIDEKVNVRTHGQDLIKRLKELQRESEKPKP